MVAFSSAILYVCVTLLSGVIIMDAVAGKYKPTLALPITALKWLVLAIAILSYVPVWHLIMMFSEDIGFWLTFNSVMFSFQEGLAYWYTLIICVLLCVFLIGKQPLHGIHRAVVWVLTLALVFVQGWGSHASSLTDWGTLVQTLHLLSIYTWVGSLLAVAWFAKNMENWERFLRWFTWLSLGCVVMAIASGFLLMGAIVPEYQNSWMLPYGQSLLVKHLIFVPVIVLAVCNGVLYWKVKRGNSIFNPIPWLRVEGVLLLLIFIMSGNLSASTPPHDVSLTLNEAVVSPLFLYFLDGTLQKDLNVIMNWGTAQFVLVVTSVLLLIGVMVAFLRLKQAYIGLVLAVVFVIIAYLTVMTSVQLT